MSEAIEKTAAGATRSLFGALGFILLMLGLEMMTEKAGIQLGLGLFLSLLGALCFYAFFFWESAKKVLSAEAQVAIGNFAQSRYTWLGVMLLVFEIIIFSRFIEEHRWPFSYPADPAMIAENAKLQNSLNERNGALGREKELADKWRFANSLRQLGRACGYRLQYTGRAYGTIVLWEELFRFGGWNGDTGGGRSGMIQVIQPGITIRVSGDAVSSPCAVTLQRALTDIYPNPPSRIAPNQQTEFLSSCDHDCVQVEIDY